MQVIIFPQDDNKVSVIYPAPEFADQIEAVAQKDVPAGKPWRIVDEAELPPRDARDRWLWSESGSLALGPSSPAPIPDLSFAQLLIGLVTEQWITEAEGNAWLAGTLPNAVLLVIDSLPAEQRFAAKARALRPSQVLRSDPLVASMGAAAGKTAAEIDTFFLTYAQV
jgi:hypothetical protein